MEPITRRITTAKSPRRIPIEWEDWEEPERKLEFHDEIPDIPVLNIKKKPVCHKSKHRNKFKGVTWLESKNLWRVQIRWTIRRNKYTMKHIGSNKSEVVAATMYDKFIYDNDLRYSGGKLRTTNYDLYGEYWK